MEIYKNIPEYENLYQVSNKGNVKSLSKKRFNGIKYYITDERILKPALSAQNYLVVGLHKDKKNKTFTIHQLVARVFLNHTPCGLKLVVNHKDSNKINNNVENLEIITNRQNCSIEKTLKSSSKYPGVSWRKKEKKWYASIFIDNKIKYLGFFETEYEAACKYNEILKNKIMS